MTVRKHEIFHREGFDLYCEVPISYAEAALGAKIHVPTLEGDYEHEIPVGTQTGTSFTVKNKGIQFLNGKGRGNLIFTVVVEVPKNLSQKQVELLRAFDGSLEGKNSAKKLSFFEKLKRSFNN